MTPASNNPPRTYEGHTVAYRAICQRYWIGGRGYVYTPMFEIWNPVHPERRIVLTPDVFDALTAPAARLAA